MEELQDAIEDAQYVNAINAQDDGPKPVLAWETPSAEVMEAWASTRKWDIDNFLESTIAFFLFSSYIKTKHQDYLRINFCEDIIRFKKYRGRSRRKLAHFIMEHYLKKLKRTPENENSVVADALAKLPKTEIVEYDLERIVVNRKSLDYLKEDPSFRIYCDYPKCSQTVVGIRDAVLDDLVDDWRDWEEHERKAASAYRRSETGRSDGDSVHSGQRKNSLGARNSSQVSLTAAPPSTLTDEGSTGGNPALSAEEKNKEETHPGEVPADAASPAKPEAPAPAKPEDMSPAKQEDPSPAKPEDPSPAKPEDPSPAKPEAVNGQPEQHPSADAVPQAPLSTQVDSRPDEPKAVSAIPHQRSVVGLTAEEYAQCTQSMRILTRKFKSQNEAVYDALFDKAETIVMESLRRDYWDFFLQSEEYSNARRFLWIQSRPVVPDDFYIMRVLGRGGFGLVNACKKGTSGKLYAMKMMNKRRIKMKKSEQLAMNERLALAAVESNFVVNLKYSFHSKEDVYLILDLMTGGDLGFHLQQKGRFPKREVQYYTARIMLGLQALHDQGYVYRDLKPENCLMADDGRVKITDLGLATRITPTLHGAAGTRGYWAPEMLRRDKKGKRMPYGHTVDWFSFGCCVTEFICGANPFRSEAALNFGLARGKQTKEKAIDCATLEMEPEFPKEFFESDAKDLCIRLLDKDETTRLGSGGCEEIMAHPYFKSLNWEAIISDKKRAPFIPAKDVNAASQSEIGNFAEDKTYQETVVTDQDDAFYRDWAWTNPRAYAAEVIEFLIYERETGRPLLPIQPNAGCCCSVL